MDDVIRRQLVIDAIMANPQETHKASWYVEQIKKLSHTQPEVTYCKNCKYHRKHNVVEGLYICTRKVHLRYGWELDDFCSYGDKTSDFDSK